MNLLVANIGQFNLVGLRFMKVDISLKLDRNATGQTDDGFVFRFARLILGKDLRGSRIVDENVVDFVNDGKSQSALHTGITQV